MQLREFKFPPKSSIFVFGLLLGLAFLPTLPSSDAATVPLQATDTSGKNHVFAASRSKATVLVFVSHDCPISNAYAPEINRIAADYARRKVDVFVVYAESGLSVAGAKQHARQFGYRVPIFVDASHRLSAAVGATVTPEAAVLSPSGQQLYLGRINNRYITWGKPRTQITQNDLRDALDAILAGKPVPASTSRAIGCFIPKGSG
jgi:hypothetical protein